MVRGLDLHPRDLEWLVCEGLVVALASQLEVRQRGSTPAGTWLEGERGAEVVRVAVVRDSSAEVDVSAWGSGRSDLAALHLVVLDGTEADPARWFGEAATRLPLQRWSAAELALRGAETRGIDVRAWRGESPLDHLPEADLLRRVLAAELLADRAANVSTLSGGGGRGTDLAEVFEDLPLRAGGAEEGAAAEAGADTVMPAIEALLARTRRDERFDDWVNEPPGRRLVIIGGPGQGKSTVGKWAAQLLRARILAPVVEELPPEQADALRAVLLRDVASGVRRLPLHVVLYRFAAALAEDPGLDLGAWLAGQLALRVGAPVPRDTLVHWLEAWPSLLVFDGLDEVPASANRDAVLAAIEHLLRGLRRAQADTVVVATTRPQGYRHEFDGPDAAQVALADLPVETALRYGTRVLAGWCREDGARAAELAGRLREALEDPLVAPLATSPLQVLILALMVDRRGNPPTDRWRLFQEHYRIIYDRERERRIPHVRVLNQHPELVDQLHADVAWRLQVAGENADEGAAGLGVAELEAQARSVVEGAGHRGDRAEKLVADILTVARDRLVFLVERTVDSYGFELRSLQEFHAAQRLFLGREERVLQRLAVLAPSAHWRNVFLFAVGRIVVDRPALLGDLVATIRGARGEGEADALARVDAWLALACLGEGALEGRPREREELEELAVEVVGLVSEVPEDGAARMLSGLPRSRFLDALDGWLNGPSWRGLEHLVQGLLREGVLEAGWLLPRLGRVPRLDNPLRLHTDRRWIAGVAPEVLEAVNWRSPGVVVDAAGPRGLSPAQARLFEVGSRRGPRFQVTRPGGWKFELPPFVPNSGPELPEPPPYASAIWWGSWISSRVTLGTGRAELRRLAALANEHRVPCEALPWPFQPYRDAWAGRDFDAASVVDTLPAWAETQRAWTAALAAGAGEPPLLTSEEVGALLEGHWMSVEATVQPGVIDALEGLPEALALAILRSTDLWSSDWYLWPRDLLAKAALVPSRATGEAIWVGLRDSEWDPAWRSLAEAWGLRWRATSIPLLFLAPEYPPPPWPPGLLPFIAAIARDGVSDAPTGPPLDLDALANPRLRADALVIELARCTEATAPGLAEHAVRLLPEVETLRSDIVEALRHSPGGALTFLTHLLRSDGDPTRELRYRLLVEVEARPTRIGERDVADRLDLPVLASPRLAASAPVLPPDPPFYLDHVHLVDVRGWAEVAQTLQRPTEGGQWTFLLGDNGAGKSSLLRGLALALLPRKDGQALLSSLQGPFARLGGGTPTVSLDHSLGSCRWRLAEGEISLGAEPPDLFLAAYGPRRGTLLGVSRADVRLERIEGVRTLFAEGANLVHGPSWLKDWHHRAVVENGATRRSFEHLLDLLCRLLPGVTGIHVTPDEVRLRGPRIGDIPLEAASDGYLATAGLYIDLLARWIERERQRGRPLDDHFPQRMTGLVLVDELDLHLHPRWQWGLVEHTRELFPNLSFVVSTHNPVTLLGARPGELYLVRDHERLEPADIPPGIGAERILTGEWFGLATTLDRGTLALLEEHNELLLVVEPTPAQRARRDELGRSLQARLGPHPDLALECLASSAVAAFLREEAGPATPERRRAAREAALEVLRRQAPR